MSRNFYRTLAPNFPICLMSKQSLSQGRSPVTDTVTSRSPNFCKREPIDGAGKPQLTSWDTRSGIPEQQCLVEVGNENMVNVQRSCDGYVSDEPGNVVQARLRYLI